MTQMMKLKILVVFVVVVGGVVVVVVLGIVSGNDHLPVFCVTIFDFASLHNKQFSPTEAHHETMMR
jgi:hypothetical protein